MLDIATKIRACLYFVFHFYFVTRVASDQFTFLNHGNFKYFFISTFKNFYIPFLYMFIMYNIIFQSMHVVNDNQLKE